MVVTAMYTRHQMECDWRLLRATSVDNSRRSTKIVLGYQARRSFAVPLKGCRQRAADVAYPC